MHPVPISIDIDSFISMISNLFRSDSVYLRELVQNALEATFQAERAGAAVTPIRVSTDHTRRYGVVTVTDGGIGMTAEELAHNLGNLFFSGWPTAPNQTLGIGKFGFGFYTIFLVADRVVVTSRALREPDRAYRWVHVRGADSATIESIDRDLPPVGTTVEAYLDQRHRAHADPAHVIDNLAEQYLYLRYPVFVDGAPLGPPGPEAWNELVHGPTVSAVEEWQERFGWDEPPLAIAPVDVDNGGFVAVVPDGVSAPPLEVYRRGVRVTEQHVIPPPLNIFVCGVVDMTEISLKPDRERLREDGDLERLREGVGAAARRLFIELADRDRSRLRRVFQAHGPYLIGALRNIPELRRALGLHVPLPLYFPDNDRGRDSATLSELCQSLPDGEPLQWANDRAADQLFADRARHLGAIPVFLGEDRLHNLVKVICSDHALTMRHVVMQYLREVERSAYRHDGLRTLFRSVVGEDQDVICVDDVDRRVPLRLVRLPSDELRRAIAFGREGPQLVVVNTKNAMIRDLHAAVGSVDPCALKQFAKIMVALAKFAAQPATHPREFEQLNREVLEVLHDRILKPQHPGQAESR